jgi:hypothetical protein
MYSDQIQVEIIEEFNHMTDENKERANREDSKNGFYMKLSEIFAQEDF